MRLRLRIERNSLPAVQTLWPVKDGSVTVCQLLQQINDIFPLEAETWGLEDYALTLAGYDLLHYHVLKDVLKDEDELVIKPLKLYDMRSRTLTGRDQISVDGRHLYDGVAFGRPLLRAPTRPEVDIPPRKKRRLSQNGQLVNGGNEEAEFVPPLMLKDVANGLSEDDDDDDDSEDDPLFQALATASDSEQGSWHSHASTSSSGEDSSSSGGSSSSDDDSSSDSDSSDTSSDSDSDDAWEGIANSDPPPPSSKTKKPLPNGVAPSKPSNGPTTGAASNSKQTAATSNGVNPSNSTTAKPAAGFVGIPNEGTATTQNRNARRRDAKRLKHMKSDGIVPQDATLTEFRGWLDEVQRSATNGDAETEAESMARVSKRVETADVRGDAGFEVSETVANSPETAETAQTTSKTEPTKTKRKSKRLNPNADTEADFEQQRQQLVDDIASGGIDVSGNDGAHDETEGPEELTSKGQSADSNMTAQTSAMVPRSVDNAARRKLDLAGSKRLVFGSLGVRVPKTQEEKDALQQRLSERAKRKAIQEGASMPTKSNSQPITATEVNGAQSADETTESWRDKINLTAVECCDEDVTLSEPPFPFHQRWDPQYNRRGKKRMSSTYMQNGGGKKRKRGQQQPVDEGYDKYNTDGYGDALNYDDAEDEEYWEDGALLNGDAEIDDEENAVDDFPALPDDITTLPLLSSGSEAAPGDIITFTELACDASTGWQPKMATRTAKVLDSPDGGLTLRVQLAMRDVKMPTYDEEGNRVYSKFEMPQQEEEDGEEVGGEGDERVRDVVWAELGQVRMLSSAE